MDIISVDRALSYLDSSYIDNIHNPETDYSEIEKLKAKVRALAGKEKKLKFIFTFSLESADWEEEKKKILSRKAKGLRGKRFELIWKPSGYIWIITEYEGENYLILKDLDPCNIESFWYFGAISGEFPFVKVSGERLLD